MNVKLSTTNEEINPFSSFFDDPKSIEKPWRRPLKNEEILDTQKVVLKAYLNKKVKKGNNLQKRFFQFTEDSICETKDDKSAKVLKIMSYHCVRLSYLFSNETNRRFGFHFTHNSMVKQFFTDDEILFKTLKKFLNYKCILPTFHEEYEVKKMIGKGSFAKVYLAEKKETGEEFAIKAFNKEFLLTQQKGQESLINEIFIMKKINHKNLLKLYQVYETKHSIYLVLEVLKGGELIKKIKEKSIYEEKDIAKIMKNILEALDHLHELGIMHRDLKPENLLLKSSEDNIHEVVIADFGLATFFNMSPNNILFKRCGTPGFVAPEILSYKDGQEGFYDEKCDIFSAGVIFYLLVTGKKPFAGGDYKQILRANKACQIDFQDPLLKHASSTTIDLMKKMLCAFPQARTTAKKALQHPYFYLFNQENAKAGSESPSKENKNYTNVLQNFTDYSSHENSKESMGSLNITTKKPLLNGRIETIEKISKDNFNSNICLDSALSPNRKTTNSKFSTGIPGFVNNNQAESGVGEESPSKGLLKKKNNYDDLHKKAIINSLTKKDVEKPLQKFNEEEKRNTYKK